MQTTWMFRDNLSKSLCMWPGFSPYDPILANSSSASSVTCARRQAFATSCTATLDIAPQAHLFINESAIGLLVDDGRDTFSRRREECTPTSSASSDRFCLCPTIAKIAAQQHTRVIIVDESRDSGNGGIPQRNEDSLWQV